MTFDAISGGPAHLVADVGGTNTRIGLCRDGDLLRDTIKRYRNTDFRDFGDVIVAYRAELDTDCSSAVIAVAGPVDADRADMTNLGWRFDEQRLSIDLASDAFI